MITGKFSENKVSQVKVNYDRGQRVRREMFPRLSFTASKDGVRFNRRSGDVFDRELFLTSYQLEYLCRKMGAEERLWE